MLKPGETAKIRALKECAVSAKLMEMGVLPGKEIRLIRKAPGGSPLYFAIDGHYIALRIEEAANMQFDALEK